MGWSNTVEMTAMVVDAINQLARLTYNINVSQENQILDPVPLLPRPYEPAREPVKPETITLAALGDLLAVE